MSTAPKPNTHRAVSHKLVLLCEFIIKKIFQELCVTESNKKMLIDRCQSAWEKINKLEVVKFKLQLDLNDKNEALQIDKDMLSLDKDCANITYKTDSLKNPKR